MILRGFGRHWKYSRRFHANSSQHQDECIMQSLEKRSLPSHPRMESKESWAWCKRGWYRHHPQHHRSHPLFLDFQKLPSKNCPGCVQLPRPCICKLSVAANATNAYRIFTWSIPRVRCLLANSAPVHVLRFPRKTIYPSAISRIA